MVDVCYSSEKRTSVERTGGIFRWKPRPATNSAMDDFPIVPPLIVKDMPRPRRLTTLKAARDYVAEAMRLHRPNPWRELWHRFKTVRTEEEAIEAIGDLRELLECARPMSAFGGKADIIGAPSCRQTYP